MSRLQVATADEEKFPGDREGERMDTRLRDLVLRPHQMIDDMRSTCITTCVAKPLAAGGHVAAYDAGRVMNAAVPADD